MKSPYTYEPLPNYSLESLIKQAQRILDSKEPFLEKNIKYIRGVILLCSMEKVDFSLAEAMCEKFIKNAHDDLKWIAIICVGHIARVYRRQVNSNIMKEIYQIYNDPTLPHWEATEIALDDIKFFLQIPKPVVPKLSH